MKKDALGESTNPWAVLFGHHHYGMNPEEETLHARYWVVLGLALALFAFAVGTDVGAGRWP